MAGKHTIKTLPLNLSIDNYVFIDVDSPDTENSCVLVTLE